MLRILGIVAFTFVVAGLPACSTMNSMTGQAPDLTGTLAKALGVTDTQASGGVGSMLQLAKEKLASGEFDQIANAIPGSQKYLDSAKQLLGGAPIGNQAGLQSAFSKLGMSPDMVSKFTPLVADYVGKVGGDQAKNLFLSALK
jgi:hypothetical protein